MYKIAQQVYAHNYSSGIFTDFRNSMNCSFEDMVFLPMNCDSLIYRTPSKQIAFYKKFCIKNKPNCVCVRGMGPDSLYAIIGCRLGGCKKILTGIHGLYSESLYISKVKKFLSKFVVEPLIMRFSTKFYTVYKNFDNKKMLTKNRKKYLGYLYNPIVNKPFNQINDKKDFPTFLYVGRMTKEKGVEYLLSAAKKYIDKYNAGKFIFVGTGELLNESLKKYSNEIKNEHFLFTGDVSNPEDFYLKSDVFILPSYHENFPCSLVEACSYKLTIIATNVGGIPEIISMFNAQKYYINYGDVDELYEALIKSAKHKDSSHKYTIPDELSFTVYQNKLHDFLLKTIGEK